MSPAPALVAELQRKIAAGWTLTVEGNTVVATGAAGGNLTIGCPSEDDAAELLAAAEALDG